MTRLALLPLEMLKYIFAFDERFPIIRDREVTELIDVKPLLRVPRVFHLDYPSIEMSYSKINLVISKHKFYVLIYDTYDKTFVENIYTQEPNIFSAQGTYALYRETVKMSTQLLWSSDMH
jgi:hypothetical protein